MSNNADKNEKENTALADIDMDALICAPIKAATNANFENILNLFPKLVEAGFLSRTTNSTGGLAYKMNVLEFELNGTDDEKIKISVPAMLLMQADGTLLYSKLNTSLSIDIKNVRNDKANTSASTENQAGLEVGASVDIFGLAKANVNANYKFSGSYATDKNTTNDDSRSTKINVDLEAKPASRPEGYTMLTDMLKKIYSNQTPVRNLGDGITLFKPDGVVEFNLANSSQIDLNNYFNANISDPVNYKINYDGYDGPGNLNNNGIVELSTAEEKALTVTIQIVNNDDVLASANLSFNVKVTGTLPDAADDE